MKVIFKNESGQEEEYQNVSSFEELIEIIEDNDLQQYGVSMYADEMHDDEELTNYYYDLATVAEHNGW